jgi:hypothetical protein
VSLIATRNITEGEKLCYWMGDVGSAESIWKFGFIDHFPSEEYPKGNVFDYVEIAPEQLFESCIGAQEDDETLLEDKTAVLDALQLLEDCYQIPLGDPRIPPPMMIAAKVLMMDQSEFEIYREELEKAHLLDDLDDSGDNPDDPIDIPDDDEPPQPEESTPSPAGSKSAKAKETKQEDEEPENENEIEDIDGDGDLDETIPQIANEQGVYQTLVTLLDGTLKNTPAPGEDLLSKIDWSKPGVIRNPASLATYLTVVEREILSKCLENTSADLQALQSESTLGKRDPENSDIPPSKLTKRE